MLSIGLILYALAVRADQALVIVDMQPRFANRSGFQERPSNVTKTARVFARQIELIERARRLGLVIVVVEHAFMGPSDERLSRAVRGYPRAMKLVKMADGMFEQPRARAALGDFFAANAVDELVVVGANGPACVKRSVEGALEAGYRVRADDRATIDFNPEDYAWPCPVRSEDLKIPVDDSRYLTGDALASLRPATRAGPATCSDTLSRAVRPGFATRMRRALERFLDPTSLPLGPVQE